MTTESSRVFPDWQLDDAIFDLEDGLDQGNAKFLDSFSQMRIETFERSISAEHKTRFAEILSDIESICNFEQEHGDGSFLNLENPSVQKTIEAHCGYTNAQIANAREAVEFRKAFTTMLNMSKRPPELAWRAMRRQLPPMSKERILAWYGFTE
jgi:hypothetical protein